MNTAETYYIVHNYRNHRAPEVHTLRTNEAPRQDAIATQCKCFNAQRLLKNGKWTKGYNFYIFDSYRVVTKEEAEAV